MDWRKTFQVKNNSGMILISGVVTLLDKSTTVIEPFKHPEKLIDDLKIFEKRGYIEVTNDIAEAPKAKKDSFAVKDLETSVVKNKAIVVSPIDTSGKAIEVSDQQAETKVEEKIVETVEAKEDKMTREQASELLNSHWKKVESEVNKITDARKLNLLQIVAQEEGVADKKKEIIEARLKEI